MPQPTAILQVLARARRDPAADLSMQALADTAGWSASHLHRAFVSVALETPKTWSTRTRLARALELLAGDTPLAEIATACGFRSHEVMTRSFRRVLGVPPSALRGRTASPHLRHAACLTLYHLPLHPRSQPMPPTISIATRAPQPVLAMTRTVPADGLQAAMAECLPAVFVHCQSQGIQLAGPPFTRYLDMSRGSFTIFAGMPVVAGEGAGEIEAGELPGGEVAVAIHVGPYDTLSETYAAIEAWVKEQGRTPSGPPWESYLTDPGEVPNPAEWQTEVCMPLA